MTPQKIEMPRIEPPPRVELDRDGSARWLKRMNWRKTSFVCTFEWKWSEVSERMESYYLQRASHALDPLAKAVRRQLGEVGKTHRHSAMPMEGGTRLGQRRGHDFAGSGTRP